MAKVSYIIRDTNIDSMSPIIGVFTSRKNAENMLKHVTMYRLSGIRSSYNEKIMNDPDQSLKAKDHWLMTSEIVQKEHCNDFVIDEIITNEVYHDRI